MPLKPKRPCTHQGCKNLQPCPVHANEKKELYERERGTSRERGYNTNWDKIRNIKRRHNPLCERCNTLAALVHHRDRNPLNNNQDNLESLCVACHQKEHEAERWGK